MGKRMEIQLNIQQFGKQQNTNQLNLNSQGHVGQHWSDMEKLLSKIMSLCYINLCC